MMEFNDLPIEIILYIIKHLNNISQIYYYCNDKELTYQKIEMNDLYNFSLVNKFYRNLVKNEYDHKYKIIISTNVWINNIAHPSYIIYEGVVSYIFGILKEIRYYLQYQIFIGKKMYNGYTYQEIVIPRNCVNPFTNILLLTMIMNTRGYTIHGKIFRFGNQKIQKKRGYQKCFLLLEGNSYAMSFNRREENKKRLRDKINDLRIKRDLDKLNNTKIYTKKTLKKF